MTTGKIVLITVPYDQVDVLRDFLDWHLELGIDLILALDGGSTDGTREILDEYAAGGRVVWSPLPDRDMTRYSIADELTAMARDRYGASWIIYADVDEFVCTRGRGLRAVLADCERDDLTLIDIPRRTMTGAPIPPDRRATEVLTLRIDRTVVPTSEQQYSWTFAVPFVFLEVGGHIAVRASAIGTFAVGAHSATVTWGRSGTSELYILHFAMRGYAEFRQKVHNTEKWLADNPHLDPQWGWHWRRWIRLEKEGRLREDYEAQFVSPARADELVRTGVCTVDTTVASWLARRQTRQPAGLAIAADWMRKALGALLPRRTGAAR
jgi:hypothetical protein